MGLEDFEFARANDNSKNKWSEIALSFVALAITLASIKTEGFEWLLYVTIPVILIALFLIVLDTGLSKRIKAYVNSRHDKKLLCRISDEYEKFIDKIDIVKKVTEEISDLEWGSTKRSYYHYPHNKISEMKSLLSDYSGSKYSKVLLINHILSIHIESADHYIGECNFLVVNRDIQYRHEHDKAEMMKLVRKYDEFRERHNEFCESINSRLRGSCLRTFYDQTYSFLPKELSFEQVQKS